MTPYVLRLRSRPGASLAVVAVSLIALLGVMSLAIDMGMMFSARNEAQRVADAAALAGASEFLSVPPVQSEAYRRAQEFVAKNYILSTAVDSATESTITVDMGNQRVRVVVTRPGIKTWFARILGINNVTVTAAAVAEVSSDNAAGARCVRPWAVQDMWHELDANGNQRLAQDGDMYGDGNGDVYSPVPGTNPQTDPTATGYGSYHTAHPQVNGYPDFGRQIILKLNDPQGSGQSVAQPGPGQFLLWNMPPDPTMQQCSPGGLQAGNPVLANSICGCNNNVIRLNQPYEVLAGDRVALNNGMDSQNPHYDGLLEKDPNARWDPATNQVVGSSHADWRQSPRVVPIAIMAPLPPAHYTSANLTHVTFTNFALMFVENFVDPPGQGGQPTITGRFLYYASGENVPGQGATVKRLRLIE